MTDSNIPDALPKSPEEIALLERAISKMLKTSSQRWKTCDLNELTSIEQRTQLLLIAAGFIERRIEMRIVSLVGTFSADIEFVATGERGMAEAVGPAIQQMWSAVGASYEDWIKTRGKASTSHCEILRDSWRLTDRGVIARNRLRDSKPSQQSVFDCVLKRGTSVNRPVCMGSGRLIRISLTTDAPVTPTPVIITNWDEGMKLFSAEVAKSIEAAFAQKSVATSPQMPDVSLSPPQIFIEGQAYALSLDAAHYLRVLVSNYGERMSDREVVNASDYLQISFRDRPRLKPLRDSVPGPVKAWIDSNESGTKIRRPG